MHVFTISTFIRTFYAINTINSLGEGLGKAMEVVVGTKINAKRRHYILQLLPCMIVVRHNGWIILNSEGS